MRGKLTMQKTTKKAFKELLNSQDDGTWRNGRYHQTKRKYGDYLYSQDPIMFDVNYREWLRELTK